MNTIFRWGIIGASGIANKFCDAVKEIEDCEIVAIGSRDKERASIFAKKNKIEAAYGSYEEMLQTEKLDAVYVATATGDHYKACKLCLQYNIPFLCEKTMCVNSKQTRDLFEEAEGKNLFCMEAMWSRFLPMIQKCKEWVDENRIGSIKCVDVGLGFCAPSDEKNRFWNPELGGGAAYDLLVYAYEILRFIIDKDIENYQVCVMSSTTGVDASDLLIIQYEDMFATLRASLEMNLGQILVIYGTKGKIVISNLLFGNEVVCYDNEGILMDKFRDEQTVNGFVYEIEEVMNCINHGKIQSKVVPHSITMEYSQICDDILEKVRKL